MAVLTRHMKSTNRDCNSMNTVKQIIVINAVTEMGSANRMEMQFTGQAAYFHNIIIKDVREPFSA